MDNPMVSVFVLAYNHEKYIRQALDGILMQQVDFPYEIVVGEDCSTDHTRAILREYQEKYPDKIKLILHEKNVGMRENANAVRRQCTGKYVANCEGDDYWTDPYKLQKQVAFLESHPEYIGAAHQVEVVNEDGQIKKGFNQGIYCQDEVYTIKHVEKGILPGHTATLVYRNILLDNPSALVAIENCQAVGDRKIALYLASSGKTHCFKDVMSHYRYVTDGESWSAKHKKVNNSLFHLQLYQELSWLAKQLKSTEIDFTYLYFRSGVVALVEMIKRPNRKNIEIFKEVYKNYNNKLEAGLRILKEIFKELLVFPMKKIKSYI